MFDADLGWRPSTDVDQQPRGIIIIIIMYNNNTKNIRQKGVNQTMNERNRSNRKRIVNNDISPNSYIKNLAYHYGNGN